VAAKPKYLLKQTPTKEVFYIQEPMQFSVFVSLTFLQALHFKVLYFDQHFLEEVRFSDFVRNGSHG
jgi:hypothetical protein